ncbi:MAG: hypothetical protein QXP53_00375 [Candidatus Pacearchaeota archaeon]
MKKTVLIITIGIIIVGVILAIIFLRKPTTQKNSFPNLIITDSKNLIGLYYDSSLGMMVPETSINVSSLPTIFKIIVARDYLFVAHREAGICKITRFNSNFEKEKEIEWEEGTGAESCLISSLATDGKNIFVSANGSLIVFNKNLNQLSRVELKIYNTNKNAHDILIYDNNAYLLDNRLIPTYLFRVNIENPSNIKIKEQIEVQGINQHLVGQWLNPEFDQWCVIQSEGTTIGSYQNVHIYPIKEGKTPRKVQHIYEHGRYILRNQLREGTENTEILAVTELPPIWAVVQKNNKYYLAKINSENDNISFTNFTDLELGNAGYWSKAIIKQKDKYLFIAFKNLLRVFDTEQQRIILSQEFGISIQDFVVISSSKTSHKINENISVTTDKKEYKQGEDVKIKVKNNLNKPIFYVAERFACESKPYEIYFYLNYSEVDELTQWNQVIPYEPICGAVEGAGEVIYKELAAHESINFIWNQKGWDDVRRELVQADPGKYIILIRYKESKDTNGFRRAYSNEFFILGSGRVNVSCNQEDPDFCNRSCETDNDCKWMCGCGCINKEEICGYRNFVCEAFPGSCKCIGNVCKEIF